MSTARANRTKMVKDALIKPVYQICPRTGAVIKLWASQTEAAKMLKCSSSGISECVNGNKETHVGFKWKDAKMRPLSYIMAKGF